MPRYVLLLDTIKVSSTSHTTTNTQSNTTKHKHTYQQKIARGDEEWRQDIVDALKEVRSVTGDINSFVGHWYVCEFVLAFNVCWNCRQARSKVIAIQSKFGSQVDLVTPGRYFVREGMLKKVYNNQSLLKKTHKKYYFALFNDVLIYAARPSQLVELYQFKYGCFLCCFVADCVVCWLCIH